MILYKKCKIQFEDGICAACKTGCVEGYIETNIPIEQALEALKHFMEMVESGELIEREVSHYLPLKLIDYREAIKALEEVTSE